MHPVNMALLAVCIAMAWVIGVWQASPPHLPQTTPQLAQGQPIEGKAQRPPENQPQPKNGSGQANGTVTQAKQEPPAKVNSGPHHPSPEKEKAEDALARYTLWLTAFTGLLAVATVILAGTTIWLSVSTMGLLKFAAEQARDMKTSLTTAAKSADAAEKSANALPALERGYVFVKPTLRWSIKADPEAPLASGPVGPDDELPPLVHEVAVHCVFANHGRTPVVLWQHETVLEMLTHPREPDNAGPVIGTPIYLFPGGQVLESGVQWSVPQDYTLAAPLDQATKDAIDAGKSFVWFYGRITYEDIFGNTRVTRFRWMYNWLSKGNALSFMPSGGKPYNERT